jgi:hypothetical protein
MCLTNDGALESKKYFVVLVVVVISLMTAFSWYFSCTPPRRLHVADFNTSLIKCDVPRTAVFCKESVECFPVIVSRYLLPCTGRSDYGCHKAFPFPRSLYFYT